MIKYTADAELRTLELIDGYLANMQEVMKNDGLMDDDLEMYFMDTFEAMSYLQDHLVVLNDCIKGKSA